MKKKLSLIICILSVCLSHASWAEQPTNEGVNSSRTPNHHIEKSPRHQIINEHHNHELLENLQERRRAREERGFQRLKQLKWSEGYTIPQHYRSDRYKVNYNSYNLPPPDNNQQWYKINGEFLLVSANHTIIYVK